VALIDLVLGPILTFIVFNKNKSYKELRNDISLIVLLQLSALGWGIYTVQTQRPVAAVYWDGTFYTVTAADILNQDLSLDVLKAYGDDFPIYLFTPYPANQKEWQPVLERMKYKNLPPFQQTELYTSLEGNHDEIYEHRIDIEEIIAHNQEMHEELEGILLQTGTQLHDNYYIPMYSKYRNVILVFDSSSSLIGTISAPLKSS